MVGKGAGACLVTLVDRASRLLEGGRSPAHTKKEVAETQAAALGGHPETKTMTLDRGMEFAGFAEVTDEEVRAVYDELNRRPRKCLGFRTPYEATTRRCCTCCENSRPQTSGNPKNCS